MTFFLPWCPSFQSFLPQFCLDTQISDIFRTRSGVLILSVCVSFPLHPLPKHWLSTCDAPMLTLGNMTNMGPALMMGVESQEQGDIKWTERNNCSEIWIWILSTVGMRWWYDLVYILKDHSGYCVKNNLGRGKSRRLKKRWFQYLQWEMLVWTKMVAVGMRGEWIWGMFLRMNQQNLPVVI